MINLRKILSDVEATPGNVIAIEKEQFLALVNEAARGQHAIAAMSNLHTMTSLATQAVGVRC